MTLCQGQRRYPRMTSSLYFPITEKDVCISSPARPAAIPPSLRRKFSAVTGAVSGGTTMLRRESPCIVRCVDVAFGEWPTVFGDQIGRASCREGVCDHVEISVDAES